MSKVKLRAQEYTDFLTEFKLENNPGGFPWKYIGR